MLKNSYNTLKKALLFSGLSLGTIFAGNNAQSSAIEYATVKNFQVDSLPESMRKEGFELVNWLDTHILFYPNGNYYFPDTIYRNQKGVFRNLSWDKDKRIVTGSTSEGVGLEIKIKNDKIIMNNSIVDAIRNAPGFKEEEYLPWSGKDGVDEGVYADSLVTFKDKNKIGIENLTSELKDKPKNIKFDVDEKRLRIYDNGKLFFDENLDLMDGMTLEDRNNRFLIVKYAGKDIDFLQALNKSHFCNKDSCASLESESISMTKSGLEKYLKKEFRAEILGRINHGEGNNRSHFLNPNLNSEIIYENFILGDKTLYGKKIIDDFYEIDSLSEKGESVIYDQRRDVFFPGSKWTLSAWDKGEIIFNRKADAKNIIEATCYDVDMIRKWDFVISSNGYEENMTFYKYSYPFVDQDEKILHVSNFRGSDKIERRYLYALKLDGKYHIISKPIKGLPRFDFRMKDGRLIYFNKDREVRVFDKDGNLNSVGEFKGEQWDKNRNFVATYVVNSPMHMENLMIQPKFIPGYTFYERDKYVEPECNKSYGVIPDPNDNDILHVFEGHSNTYLDIGNGNHLEYNPYDGLFIKDSKGNVIKEGSVRYGVPKCSAPIEYKWNN